MDFLYPLFFAGTLAAILPIAIHLLTRKNRKTIVFSDLTLLQQIDAEESPRYRWENLILMLLRALLCILVAFLFMQPVFKTGHGFLKRPGQGTAVALVLDNSRSMGTSEGGVVRYQKAREKALEILKHLRGEDEAIAIFASSRSQSSHASPTPYREEVVEAIENSSVAPFASSFVSGVQLALEALEKSPQSNKELYIFTDGQENGFVNAPSSWSVETENLNAYFGYLSEKSGLPNAAIENVEVSPLSAKPGDAVRLRAEILPTGENLPSSVQVQLRTGPNNRRSREIPIASGNPSTVEFSFNRSPEEVDTGEVELQADVLESDNRALYALPEVRPIRIVMSQGAGNRKTLLFL